MRLQVRVYSQVCCRHGLSIFPFVLALTVLGLMVWTALLLVEYPDDGIDTVEDDGFVTTLSPEGAAQGKLKEQDVIKTIDGVAWNDIHLYYPELGKSAGDPVEYMVERQGQIVAGND